MAQWAGLERWNSRLSPLKRVAKALSIFYIPQRLTLLRLIYRLLRGGFIRPIPDPDDDTKMLHEGTSSSDSSYGAVYAVASHTTDDKGAFVLASFEATPAAIRLDNVSLAAGHTLTIHVNNVRILSRASNYVWATAVSGPNGDHSSE